MFHFEKNVTVFEILPVFVCVFRTTGVEDAHLTLAVIPFLVRVTNFLIFLLAQAYKLPFL